MGLVEANSNSEVSASAKSCVVRLTKGVMAPFTAFETIELSEPLRRDWKFNHLTIHDVQPISDESTWCQTTSVSAAHATHCATHCTPCRPLIPGYDRAERLLDLAEHEPARRVVVAAPSCRKV